MRDYRGGGKKTEWRQHHVAFMLGSKLYKAGKITHGIVSLAGDFYTQDGSSSGIEQFELIEPHLVSPRQFHTCEIDPIQVFNNRRRTEVQFDSPYADFYVVAMREAQYGDPHAAIFDLDLTRQVGLQSFWSEHGAKFTKLVDTALKYAPEVVFMLNNTLDRSSADNPPETRLRVHAQEIAKAFSAFGVTPERLLGKRLGRGPFLPEAELVRYRAKGDQGRRPENDLHTGWAGAFEIYRSEGRPSRMATVRLRLTQERTAIIEHDEGLNW
jgi:hypothetical protein